MEQISRKSEIQVLGEIRLRSEVKGKNWVESNIGDSYGGILIARPEDKYYGGDAGGGGGGGRHKGDLRTIIHGAQLLR